MKSSIAYSYYTYQKDINWLIVKLRENKKRAKIILTDLSGVLTKSQVEVIKSYI